jgi:Mrp family chromosome partitioning ATPase/capsular polysaccharide biosynthesis protein
MAASALYLKKDAPSYKSTALVQLAGATQGTQSSGLSVNTTPQFVTGPQVAAAAAKVLGVSGPGALGASVSASTNSATGQLSIVATAPTSVAAEAVANAYATKYVQVLSQEAQANTATLETRLTQAENQINQLQQEQIVKTTITQPTGSAAIAAEIQAAQNNYQAVNAEYVAAQIAPAPATVLDPAGLGALTRSEKKILGIALLIGVLTGAGLGLARDQMDTRVRHSNDIATTVDTPVLAELPVDSDGKHRDDALPVLENPRSPFAEAVRELRTSVQVLLADVACPVIVVTSPEPADGKTFVASNLAVSFALAGKRTVIVSADIRRNRLDGVFSTDVPTEGLATLLGSELYYQPNGTNGNGKAVGAADRGGRLSVTDLLWQTDVERLRLLPAGTTGRDPADLLASRTMQRILTELREQSDVVIMDTPPALAVADAAILASIADGAVVVVSADKTNHAILEQTVKRLTAAEGNVLGVAFNRSRAASTTTYEGYYSSMSPSLPARAKLLVAGAEARNGRQAGKLASEDAPAEAELNETEFHEAPRTNGHYTQAPAAYRARPINGQSRSVNGQSRPINGQEAERAGRRT